jgi:hypothetical protein
MKKKIIQLVVFYFILFFFCGNIFHFTPETMTEGSMTYIGRATCKKNSSKVIYDKSSIVDCTMSGSIIA